MYLSEADVLQMMSIIEKTFRKVTVMIETMSPFVVKHIKEKSIEGSHAKFTWGVKNGKKLQSLVSAFTYKGEVSLVEGMKKMFPTVIDESAKNFAEIYVSGGRIGLTLKMKPQDLVAVTNAQLVDIQAE